MQGRASLLELDRCTSLFQRFLRCFGFVLADAFLDGGRSTVNQGLGFFQAQTGQFANSLDRVHFLVASGGQNDVELGLFFSGSSATGSRASCNSSSSGYTELLFHCADQFNDLHNGHFGYCVDDIFVGQSHDSIFLYWGTTLGVVKTLKANEQSAS